MNDFIIMILETYFNIKNIQTVYSIYRGQY